MAINKKLIHFKTKQKFNEELANGNILETSIVFILDSKEIYTHGQYYGDLSECLTKYPQEFTKEEKEQMLENLGYYAVEWDGSSETIELSDEEYRKVLSATNVYLVLMDTIYLLPTIKTNEIYFYNLIQENIISMFSLDTSTNPMALTGFPVLIPRTTSELGNDSNFISSDNLKTINGESILGEGDIIIPTKVSELVNDANYILDDVISDGVYAVNANGKLIDYNTADATALGVALVAGEHKFMIAKSDATNNGSNYNLYYDYDKGDLSLTNYSNADGTNSYGYLGGSSTPQLSQDFTTWTAGALSDFNGKTNTEVIAASSSNAKDMCKVLETFNAGSDNQGHTDWYVPACGQLALMYLAKTDINAALAKIGGTALESDYYWSSSEYDADDAWCVSFNLGYVDSSFKDNGYRVRFVRNISVKSLKERVDDLESSKQDTLISGTNIKTINGTSILGSGNIVIEGGSSSGGGYAEVSHGTSNTTFTITPNTFHVWDEVTLLDLSFAEETAGVANEYLFQFTSGATATTLTLPDGLKWANDSAPTIAENKIYQVSVLKGLASVLEFNNAVELIDNKAILTNAQDGEVTFQYPVASTITVSVRGDMIDSIIFNEGEQTKSASESCIVGYTIVSVTPNKDNIYNYIF